MKNLQTKLVVNFLPLIVFPLVLAVIASSLLSIGMLKKSFTQRLNESLRGAELAINFEQEKLINGARAIASEEAFIRSIRHGDRQALLKILEHARTVLGMDTATVLNREGVVMASGRNPARYGNVKSGGNIQKAFNGTLEAGLVMTDAGLSININLPVFDKRKVVCVLNLANIISYDFISDLKAKYGLDIIVLSGGRLQATTMKDSIIIHDVVGKFLGPRSESDKEEIYENLILGRERFFLIKKPVLSGEKTGYLFLALSSEKYHDQLMMFIIAEGVFLAVLLLATILISRLTAGRIVRPIGALSRMAGEISKGNLFQRVAIRSEDEIGNLAGSFNEMAGNLLKISTERKKMEDEIRHMAHHDPVTGLPNRRFFQEIIAIELAQTKRSRNKLAVFFLDLDRFKEINDTLGHEAGDQLLKVTAGRLKAVVRTSNTVARIGGDEFNVILSNIAHPEDAAEAALKILKEIRKPFMIKGHQINISTSIGISVYPDDGEETETLLRYADIAMYHVKENGRNNYQFYNKIINTRSIERMRFENSLRQAIDRGEFRLHFQPLVNVVTGEIVSAEALLRWQHPEKGLLEPESFFRAAEDIGLMRDIDEWVLEAVARQIRTWMDEGVSPVCVTINLSAWNFQSPGLVTRISLLLKEIGVPPWCINIEITETAAMSDIETTIGRVSELRAIGFEVSIDDFGTGYSSLNYLKRLPIQKLKIDKSFIRDIATDSDDRAIVAAVLLMAHTMNLKVVAEGVEEADQLFFLRSLRCDEAQGFLFSRPVPAHKFMELVAARI